MLLTVKTMVVLGFLFVILPICMKFAFPPPPTLERYTEMLEAWWTLRMTHAWEANIVQQLAGFSGVGLNFYSQNDAQVIQSGLRAVGSCVASWLYGALR